MYVICLNCKIGYTPLPTPTYVLAFLVGKDFGHAPNDCNDPALGDGDIVRNPLITKLLRKYEDELNQMPSDKEIKAVQTELDKTLNDAVKAGILSKDDVEQIRLKAEDQKQKLIKKAKDKGAGNCLDDKNLEKYHQMLGMYVLSGAITERINNNDLIIHKRNWLKDEEEIIIAQSNSLAYNPAANRNVRREHGSKPVSDNRLRFPTNCLQ